MLKTGIVNLWELPTNRTFITMEEDLKIKMVNLLLEIYKTKYQIQKQLYISRATILKISKYKNPKVRLDIILKISNELKERGYKKFEFDNLQSKVKWIGAPQSNGINNPKLPFDFNISAGARFLSAISGDGSITSGNNIDYIKSKDKYSYGTLIYTNINKNLINSVINDTKTIFGGTKDIATLCEGTRVLFPFICRDALELITNFKGMKSENNPNIPSFIFTDKELMCGWLEQIIADESEIRYYPRQYEKSIVWRRSVDISDIFNQFKENYEVTGIKSTVLKEIGKIRKCNLIEGEGIMLDKLGIRCILKPIDVYFTKNNRIKLRWEIRISGKEN